MFFIAGITQKKVNLPDKPQNCPKCRSLSLTPKRIDTYFSLFFIPLFPVKKGKIFMECSACKDQELNHHYPAKTKCPNCRVSVSAEYPYCPYCRAKL